MAAPLPLLAPALPSAPMRPAAARGSGGLRFRHLLATLGIACLATQPGVARVRLGGSVEHAAFGKTAAGEPVVRYTLSNARGAHVAILTYGATIDRVEMPDRHGRFANVVVGVPDIAAREKHGYMGTAVGRFANRISGGGFTLDGRRYRLSPDPTAVVLHGGSPGWAEKVWQATPCATRGCSAVTLRLVSPDGENGFPGRVEASVTYTLSADNALRIDYRATTTAPTVVNMTNHSYFNLAGEGTVLDQRLQVAADSVLALDANRVPTGRLRPVAGTPFDLRAPARIGDRIDANDPMIRDAGGFDHNWVLARAPRPSLPVVAHLTDPASGRTMEVRTSEPGVQVYSANGWNGSFADSAGRAIPRAGGIALETQGWPDSPNQPGFPSTVLRPGKPFRSSTIFRFGVTR